MARQRELRFSGEQSPEELWERLPEVHRHEVAERLAELLARAVRHGDQKRDAETAPELSSATSPTQDKKGEDHADG